MDGEACRAYGACEAPAKVNLHLRVLGKRPDGYHDLDMVNATLDLYDRVSIDPSEHLAAETDHTDVPKGPANLAYRAAFAFAARTQVRPAWRIFIEKRIPMGSGLGGGSSDAAAVLRLLNEAAGRPLSAGELVEVAEEIGADCPYLLFGDPARCRGIGEKVEGIPLACEIPIVVAHPGIPVATAEVFREVEGCHKPGDGPESLLAFMRAGDLRGIAAHLANDLLPITARRVAEVPRLIGRLLSLGALGASMSGSGSGVFGISESPEVAERIAESLRAEAPFVWWGRVRGAAPVAAP